MMDDVRDSGFLTLDVRPDGLAVMTFDVPGETQNTLKEAFAPALESMLTQVVDDDDIRAVVLMSGKPDSFLAGADVGMLARLESAEEASALARRALEVFARIEGLSKPVVAAIHGPCLGGGLELALACHGRVCTDDSSTVLAAPEVQLGLLPGAGGTQRLPRLIGIGAALDMMLTGRNIRPRKARRLGLVDDVVERPILLEVSLQLAGKLVHARPAGVSGRRHRVKSPQDLFLEDNLVGRKLLFQQAHRNVIKKTWGNYPAPERIIDAVRVGFERGLEAGYEAENRYFGELAVSAQARALMSIFFATRALKKGNGVEDPDVRPKRIARVGVLGAGLMGSGIAYVSAFKAGHAVRMKDRTGEAIARGMKSIAGVLDGRVEKKAMTRPEADRVLRRITATTDYSGFSRCQIVIEAVFEDLELKQTILRDIESLGNEEMIFASNTSSIPISRIAEAASRPERVIGMHYFSPVEKMPLLEIITTDRTSPEVTATCVALGRAQGKTVIVVRDGVGFYTSRILAPYMNEAARIVSEGVAIDVIDRSLKQWGFPVGPMQLLDEVGIDVAAKVGPIMVEAFGARMEPPAIMAKLHEDGRLCRKNGRGFYRYSAGERGSVDPSVYRLLGGRPEKPMDPVLIAERCALLMINEAVLCLEEGIIENARDGDVGAVFGLGFPPFRGGPFRYVDEVGADVIVEKMEKLVARCGERFEPAPRLRRMAESSTSFHGDDS